MRELEYLRATDVAGAVAAVAEREDAVFLAGGTNVVDHLKLGVARPGLLVDVTHLPLGGVGTTGDGGLRIGATVRNADLAAHPAVRTRYPVLARALLAGASGQIRNVATTAGNLLQRTRCGYFQDVSTPCNKRDPGSGCSALGGWTRYHAVLGASTSCVAVHPSDMAVAMAALDAVVEVSGPRGERELAVADLHRLPGQEPERDTVLAHGELITAVRLPPMAMARTSTYRKVRDRASYAFALVSVAAALEVAEGRVVDVRLALGGVAHAPWRALRAEEHLRAGPATTEAFARAAGVELADAVPVSDNGFKIPLAQRTVAAVLEQLAGLAS